MGIFLEASDPAIIRVHVSTTNSLEAILIIFESTKPKVGEEGCECVWVSVRVGEFGCVCRLNVDARPFPPMTAFVMPWC